MLDKKKLDEVVEAFTLIRDRVAHDDSASMLTIAYMIATKKEAVSKKGKASKDENSGD